METILRGEFPDFDEYKEVRKRGKSYVKMIFYSRFILYSRIYNWFHYLAILWVLFASNIRLAAFNSTADKVYDGLNIVLLIFFIFDFALNLIGALDYIISFYFWTDIMSMIVMIFDLTFVRNSIF